MRLSFKRFHRRTTSEPLGINAVLSQPVPVDTATRRPASWPGVFSAWVHDLSRPVDHVFTDGACNESEATKLSIRNMELLTQLSDLQSQIHKVRSEMYSELHVAFRQRERDRQEIQQLKAALREKALSGSSPTEIDQVLRVALVASEPSESPIVSPALGPRKMSDYRSALRLTLHTRMELKNSRKTKKFWKQVAQRDENNTNVVTPSCSNISSIDEGVTSKQQKTVEIPSHKRTRVECSPIASPVCEGGPLFKGETPDDVFLSQATVFKSDDSQTSTPSLSPLASHSLKMEITKSIPSSRRTVSKPVSKTTRLLMNKDSSPRGRADAKDASITSHTPPRGILKPRLLNSSTHIRNAGRYTSCTGSNPLPTTNSSSRPDALTKNPIFRPERQSHESPNTTITLTPERRLVFHAERYSTEKFVPPPPKTPTLKRFVSSGESQSRLPVSSVKKQLKCISLTKPNACGGKENGRQDSPAGPHMSTARPL